jgi:hypothetical protein
MESGSWDAVRDIGETDNMTMDTDAWFQHLQQFHWLTHAPVQLTKPQPLADGRWSLRQITVTEAELAAAKPAEPVEQVRLFHLVHDDWRVASFRLFRPLVYFAAFSSPDVFACL